MHSRYMLFFAAIALFGFDSRAAAENLELLPGSRRVLKLNGVDFAFRWCPPGTFMMGSTEAYRKHYGDKFVPQHRVQITCGFWMSETEITQSQYKSVMKNNPSYREKRAKYPVNGVTWNDATEFCRKISGLDKRQCYRLPSEAEWEYACRAGKPECRYGELRDIAWFFENTDFHLEGSTGPQPVGTKAPNAWGLHDMLGNVSEWCADWHHTPATTFTLDPEGPKTGKARLIRGGNCYEGQFMFEGECLAGTRYSREPEHTHRSLGFRVVLTEFPGPKAVRGEPEASASVARHFHSQSSD